jgi:hypothetical protein
MVSDICDPVACGKNGIEKQVRKSFENLENITRRLKLSCPQDQVRKVDESLSLVVARYLIPRKSRVGAAEHELELNSAESNDHLRKFGLME